MGQIRLEGVGHSDWVSRVARSCVHVLASLLLKTQPHLKVIRPLPLCWWCASSVHMYQLKTQPHLRETRPLPLCWWRASSVHMYQQACSSKSRPHLKARLLASPLLRFVRLGGFDAAVGVGWGACLSGLKAVQLQVCN